MRGSGIRRLHRANGGNVKGQRGRVARFFHDRRLRVKVEPALENEKGREQTKMSLSDGEHVRRTPCWDNTGKPPAQFPPQHENHVQGAALDCGGLDQF